MRWDGKGEEITPSALLVSGQDVYVHYSINTPHSHQEEIREEEEMLSTLNALANLSVDESLWWTVKITDVAGRLVMFDEQFPWTNIQHLVRKASLQSTNLTLILVDISQQWKQLKL